MAAEMLFRLGFECSVADLYADTDTRKICENRVKRLNRLADVQNLERFVREHDFTVFTGGLEGRPALADILARWTKTALASSQTIVSLADYEVQNAAMRDAKMDRYLFSRDVKKMAGAYVQKDLSKSGKTFLNPNSENVTTRLPAPWVAQRLIDGESVSLIFVSHDSAVECLGGSFQLADTQAPMSWSGSVSGLNLELQELESATRFASAISQRTELKGVFGIDFIVNQNGIWPVDVNPRIPASAEVVGDHVMSRHLAAFGIECPRPHAATESFVGKRIVFNRTGSSVRFDRTIVDKYRFRFEDPFGALSVADVPEHSAVIEADHPVLTVLTSGPDLEDVKARLAAVHAEISSALQIY